MPKKPRPKPKVSKDYYGYLHGYDGTEQNRLIDQARFYEHHIYRNIHWPEDCKKIMEPGCGVGAQTQILCRRFPELKITSVDRSKTQLAKASQLLKPEIAKKKVQLIESEANNLPFKDSTYDGAFVCFLLEHLPNPKDVLIELHRILKPNSRIYCTEVFNASFFLEPYAPATLKYWFEFNDLQWNMAGHPFIGALLANLLLDTGYRNVETEIIDFHLDKRSPKQRIEYMKRFFELLMSAAPNLLKAKKVDQNLVSEVKAEWNAALRDPNSVLVYSIVQAKALSH